MRLSQLTALLFCTVITLVMLEEENPMPNIVGELAGKFAIIGGIIAGLAGLAGFIVGRWGLRSKAKGKGR